jgi:hypothetical protein
MTAAADRPVRSWIPVSSRRTALAALTATLLMVGTGCTSGQAAERPTEQLSDRPAASAEPIPPSDEQAIHTVIDRLNTAAAGAVPAQQAVLAAVVDPTLLPALEQCQPATTTVRFEPVFSALRSAPGWSPANGILGGTVYALPSLIRIYTGERITGTDLTTLHFGVTEGEAYLTPLCVG